MNAPLFRRLAEQAPAKKEINEAVLLARGWRRVAGFDRYLVSRSGQIFSSIRAGRVMRPSVLNTGYEYVSLMATGAKKPTKMLVHRIVAQAFCDGSGQVVNHKDGNKRNNHADNLEWCSFAENNDHARDAGLVANFGSCHYAAKLCATDILEIRRRCEMGEMHKDVARSFGVSREAIGKIARGQAWRRVV